MNKHFLNSVRFFFFFEFILNFTSTLATNKHFANKVITEEEFSNHTINLRHMVILIYITEYSYTKTNMACIRLPNKIPPFFVLNFFNGLVKNN